MEKLKRYTIIQTQSRGEVVIESASGDFILKRLEKNVEVNKQAKENERKAKAWDKIRSTLEGRFFGDFTVQEKIVAWMDKILAEEKNK